MSKSEIRQRCRFTLSGGHRPAWSATGKPTAHNGKEGIRMKLTSRQAAIVGAYTGVLAGPFSEMHRYVEEVMGRPVWTHEMASKKFTEQLRLASKDDFLSICAPQSPSDAPEWS